MHRKLRFAGAAAAVLIIASSEAWAQTVVDQTSSNSAAVSVDLMANTSGTTATSLGAVQQGAQPQTAVIRIAEKAPVILTSQGPLDNKIAAISNWVLHGESKAEPVTVIGDAALLMGLSRGANVTGTGARAGNANTAIFFVTLPGRTDVVLARRDVDINRTVYWLIRDGAFSATVQRLNGGDAQVVSGPVYKRGGNVVLDFFYTHLPASDGAR